TLSTERSYTEPWGLFGGLPGKHSYCGIKAPDGQEKQLPARITTEILKDNTIIFQTPGAGGMGNPLKRNQEEVRRDVLNELVSIERAKSVYGVVIDPQTLEIDQVATDKIRN